MKQRCRSIGLLGLFVFLCSSAPLVSQTTDHYSSNPPHQISIHIEGGYVQRFAHPGVRLGLNFGSPLSRNTGAPILHWEGGLGLWVSRYAAESAINGSFSRYELFLSTEGGLRTSGGFIGLAVRSDLRLGVRDSRFSDFSAPFLFSLGPQVFSRWNLVQGLELIPRVYALWYYGPLGFSGRPELGASLSLGKEIPKESHGTP